MIDADCELPDLNGQSVLIADLNPLIALDMAATISGWGGQPVLYYDLAEPAQLAALATAKAALVDVRHNRESAPGLIAALVQQGVPTVLTTADGSGLASDHFPGMKIFDKPVAYTALAQWFCRAVS